MLTAAATRSHAIGPGPATVLRIGSLLDQGWTRDAIRAQVAAGRWQRDGRVVVLHNAGLTVSERRAVALAGAGPRVVLTSFTALEVAGLMRWTRPGAHILVPAGARVHRAPDTVVHYTGDWGAVRRSASHLHRAPDAALLAAASLADARAAVGLMAAVVQQRLCSAVDLQDAVAHRRGMRHHAVLTACLADVAQGAQALSEIDFARLCRRAGLPPPRRQAIRTDKDGRRRYLDAEWTRADGRRVVAEVDGALHLLVDAWWSDQARQNELVLGGDIVLRFPSVAVRIDSARVADTIRRALIC